MSATTTLEPAATLLGRPQSALALRICGTDRHGQIVRLQSSRVAIGSSAQCTLRLRAPGVAPWHCLVLRGREHTIVRRWNVDTRLNDAAFDDALLTTGDRLSIGPIEFEVLDDRQVEQPRADVAPAPPAPHDTLPGNDLNDQLVQRLQARLAIANDQSRLRIRRLIDELRAQRGENAMLQHLADSRIDEEEDAQQWAQLEAERQALAEELAAAGEKYATEAGSFAAERESFERQLNDLAAQKAAIESQRANVEAMRLSLVDREAQLEAMQRERETAKQQQIAESHRQASEAAENRLNAERESWAREKTAWETERDGWLAQQREWEAERIGLQLKLNSAETERAQLVSQAATAKTQDPAAEKELLHQQAQLAEQQAKLDRAEGVLTEQRNALDQRLAKLETDERALANQRSQWDTEVRRQAVQSERLKAESEAEVQNSRKQAERQQAELAAAAEQLQRREQEITEQSDRLAKERQDFELQKQQFELQVSEAEAKSDQLQDQLASEEQLAKEEPAAIETIDPPAEEAMEAEPANPDAAAEDDVFARLRALSLLKGDDKDITAANRPSPKASDAEEPSVEDAESAAIDLPPRSGHEEESIDDYMNRLLQRVRGAAGEGGPVVARGASGSPPRGASGSSNRPTSNESTGAAEAPGSKLKGIKLEPRNQAPEKLHDLAAMREIANFSARSAIATHQLRRGSEKVWQTVTMAGAALACGVWLLLTTEEMDSPYFYGGWIGIIVSLFWLLKSGVLARAGARLKRHHEQHLAKASRELLAKKQQPAEEPAAQEPEPAAE